ncbi:prion-like-(Q/N-rich) domain-bearing protein 25 [Ruditapes philippinarum]|uniref:prion-like-(Q/N-rich) domain-bearing protein 25 n=1 Tax=Ruditapes philippinarum TaxID=129788 RepID=UPI00295AEA1B|nr:prion-like-(Q/N-rich) domain-bearing protein 25 [Ruditapes philippinarum]
MTQLAFSGLKIIILILGLTGHICCAALGTTCDANNAQTVCTEANADCSSGKCSCQTNFVEEKGHCLKAVGQQCAAATECVSNADCDTTCKCKEGLVDTNGLCAKPLGTTCDANNAQTVCTEANADCSSGKCSCQTNFVEENGHCLKAVGQQCAAATECVSNADCDTTCKCKEGLVDTNGLCAKPKVSETQCHSNTECTVSNSECDTQATKCKCKNTFTESSPDGTSCTASTQTTLGTTCDANNAQTVCTEANADCSSGKCSCQTNFVEENGHCLKAVGQQCAAATECISNADCDTTCKCKEGLVDTNGLCAKPSSATSVKTALSVMSILTMLNILLKMF